MKLVSLLKFNGRRLATGYKQELSMDKGPRSTYRNVVKECYYSNSVNGEDENRKIQLRKRI